MTMTEIEEETYNVTISKCTETGQRLSQVWRNQRTGKIDNPYGPAETVYHDDAKTPQREVFWVNGKVSRLGKPAITAFDEAGRIRQESFVIDNMLHADVGPSSMFFDDSGQPEEAHYHKDGLPVLKVKVVGFQLP